MSLYASRVTELSEKVKTDKVDGEIPYEDEDDGDDDCSETSRGYSEDSSSDYEPSESEDPLSDIEESNFEESDYEESWWYLESLGDKFELVDIGKN